MTYPFIPIGLIALFIIYLLFLLFIRKDQKRFKTVFYPGLFFIAVWMIIYYLILT